MSIHAKNARNAITHYKVLKRFGDYTYIPVSYTHLDVYKSQVLDLS